MGITVNILERLKARLGGEHVRPHVLGPTAAYPGTESEVSEAVAIAATAGVSVWPCGAGTYIDALEPVPSDALLLFSERMNRVTEYRPDDMVVSVEAGATFGALQDALDKRGQWIPLELPDADKATVGGIVAASPSDPWSAVYHRFGYHVLEVRAVDAQGRRVRAGARVVKNVAGYDMPRLYAGSRGTLVFITQVTFVTRPKPPVIARLSLNTDTWESLMERLMGLSVSEASPAWTCVVRDDIQDTGARPTAGIVLAGQPETVEWQTSRVMDAVRGAGSMVSRIPELPVLPAVGDVEIIIRVRPSETLDTWCRVVHSGIRAAAAGYPMEGRIELRTTANADTPNWIAEMRAWMSMRGGAVIVERMPRGWIGAVQPFGAPRPEHALARAIKKSLDPNGLFPKSAPGLDMKTEAS